MLDLSLALDLIYVPSHTRSGSYVQIGNEMTSIWFTHIKPRIVDVDERADIPMSELQALPHLNSKWNKDAFDGCLELASQVVTGGMLLRQIEKEKMTFEKHHFYMLLRELILARLTSSPREHPAQRISANGLPVSYYIDWLIYEITVSDSKEVRDWVTEAASSVVNQTSHVHHSPFFTAYRGFFLLGRTGDHHKILQTLTQEHGVTSHGVDLAGMLLGAALGESYISSIDQ